MSSLFNVLKYQYIKNRIEFRDIVDYSEIINELLSNIIEWSYLRERDLMFFQFGFHYLNPNSDNEKPDGYREYNDSIRTIKGFVLYQIASLYMYSLPIYGFDDKNRLKKRKGEFLCVERLTKNRAKKINTHMI